MMDYSKLSDAEINEAVAIARGTLISKGKAISLYQIEGADLCTDFCNSPADAWPIIVGNAIGLMPFKKGESEAWSLSAGLLSNTAVKHENPLRAAMIVYLMMNEVSE